MNAGLQAREHAHAKPPATTESSALRKAPTSLLVRALYQRRRNRPQNRSRPQHLQPAPGSMAAPGAELQPGEAASQGHRGAPAPKSLSSLWRARRMPPGVWTRQPGNPPLGQNSRTSCGGQRHQLREARGSPHGLHATYQCSARIGGVECSLSTWWLNFYYTSCYVS